MAEILAQCVAILALRGPATRVRAQELQVDGHRFRKAAALVMLDGFVDGSLHHTRMEVLRLSCKCGILAAPSTHQEVTAMNPVTDDVLKKEYRANGVNVSPELEANMMKAAKVLTNTKQMKAALKALSDAMLEKYKNDMAAIDDKIDRKAALLAMQQKNREDNDKSRHLLSNVLTEFETKNGFNTFVAVNGHPRIIQMTGLLGDADFIATVGAGHAAKDYVTVDHGVYSRRIQWYCIGHSKAFDVDLKGLYVSFQSGNAWLLTFDRRNEHPRKATGDGNIDTLDFRTPEKLHAYLKATMRRPNARWSRNTSATRARRSRASRG